MSVRGVRNTPCITRPGKRAPTVAMCESDENYVPLNDGYNWKGDPNATLSGQRVPQLTADGRRRIRPGHGRTYIGPDGRDYTQTNLGAWRVSRPRTGSRCCCRANELSTRPR